MRILLDENLPKQLKADFGPNYEVKTVRDMVGWAKRMANFWDLLFLTALTFSLRLTKIFAISKILTVLN